MVLKSDKGCSKIVRAGQNTDKENLLKENSVESKKDLHASPEKKKKKRGFD